MRLWTLLLIALCLPAVASEQRVRAIWGGEALWGYWAFDKDYVSKTGWTLVSVSQDGPGDREKVANLFDDNVQTFFSPRGKDAYDVTIDLGKSFELGAFTILTLAPLDPKADTNMAKYEFFVSESKDAKGTAVAQGAFEAGFGKETVVTFPAMKGRYVSLHAVPAENAEKVLVIRELSVVEATVVTKYQAESKAELAEKPERWANRNSAQAIDALGVEFLDQLFCEKNDINRVNLQGRPKLEAIGKLKAAGKYAEALKVFRDYFFDKMRRPQWFGLHANDLHPYGRGYAGVAEFPQSPLNKDLDSDGQKKQVELADEMLKGRMTLGNGTKVEIGEPGAVDWMAPGMPYGQQSKNRVGDPYKELWTGSAFLPLFTAYTVTKNEVYLKRWLDYMDDWALNSTFLGETHPVINSDNQLYPVVTTMRMIASIANTLPYDSEVVPPATFARIMKKLVHDTPLNSIVYFRANPNAWTPGAGMMLFAMMIDEFKAAPMYFRETRRRNIEDITAVQLMRDGTDPHYWPGYNPLIMINMAVIRLMNARESMPGWAHPKWEQDLRTPEWQNEFIELMTKRASYCLRWVAPNGEYPLVSHFEPPSERGKIREVFDRNPAMLNDPINAKIYSLLYSNKVGGVPEYTSEWFPYAGWNIARTGWGQGEGYGSMFCAPKAGSGGGGSGCKNNIFGLAAYGMDLVADDLAHYYVRRTSPISVDKRQQMIDFNTPRVAWPTGHKGELFSIWQDPAPWRWHASDNFNVMEGVYSGVYAVDYYNRKDFTDDVAHQRLALFARRAGLWIVTDRMLTTKKHDYEQLWWLPLKKAKRDVPAFMPEEIKVDAAARTIKTSRTRTDKWFNGDQGREVTVGNVNLSMYQFTDAAPTYDSKSTKSDEFYDWQRVGVTWQGEGNQQIVTALFPRKPTPEKEKPDGTENDLVGMKTLQPSKGINGFEAQTPDGFRVAYLAAASKDGALEINGITLQGEALLLVWSDTNPEVTGVALGCKEMSVKGSKVAIPGTDFEFALPTPIAASFKAESIHRPISPVQILPEADAFAGELEVTLKCETPGTRMTYTLDGTEPTPQATPYNGPFKINTTYVVKARAYRTGVEKNPPHTSGTLATPTSVALYTQKLPSLPEQATPKSPGLNYEYFEGFWKDLWLSLDKQQSKKKGAVTEVFDLSVLPDDNRPLGEKRVPCAKTYAFKYTGFLNVPEDGVYTIHAPREFTYPDTIAGYELQVSLGHATQPDGRREGEMSFWYPATRLHGLGTWSMPLKKGFHELKIVYIDFRMDGPKRLNWVANVRECAWSGEKPALMISGPKLEKQPIPGGWLWH